ncbi:MAG: CehA/McbA family metallohydrolase [Actinomycetota bacterium]|nr:CehA/McbA family metallohydrolase [Actinomycetota bacterium]
MLSVLASLGEWAAATLVALRRRTTGGAVPVCEPGGAPVVIKGTAFPGDEKQNLLLPFEVRPGTARLEIDYDWESLPPAPPKNLLTQTIFDMGVWDEQGYRSADGFRGWSGSRHKHVFLQADVAQRAYRPGPISPGTWHVDLGIAAVGPTGAEWTVAIRARQEPDGPVATPPAADPVDPSHVARPEPGWYHGDFHMHAWHSNPKGPTPDEFVAFARAAHLDFLPVTEYVVGHHWGQYGEAQRQNPDLVIWPGREIVTYHGHVQSLGETPGFVEFRHGFEDVSIGDIQAKVRERGALFGVNHPTTFPGPLFQNLCRGCEFELGDQIDWDAVDTIEILTGEALVDPGEYQLPDLGVKVPNPFFPSAVDLWESLLNRGHKITAVCGSDDKLGPKLGACATAVFASELSRPALMEAIRAGRAYVRARGVAHSPALDMRVEAPGQDAGTFGSVMVLDGPDAAASLNVAVTGGKGQSLALVRNGDEASIVPVASDPFEHTFSIRRIPREGPLGTWYRVETFDTRGRTTIGNPVFLQGSA